MNTISRTITGTALILLGLILIAIPFIFSVDGAWASWIYGVPILIIGVFILFNKDEDKIEEIRR